MQPQSKTRGDPLTRREAEIVGLLFELDCNKAIANRLGLSEVTVKSYLTSAFAKMGVVSRLQAAVLWDREQRRNDDLGPCFAMQRAVSQLVLGTPFDAPTSLSAIAPRLPAPQDARG